MRKSVEERYTGKRKVENQTGEEMVMIMCMGIRT